MGFVEKWPLRMVRQRVFLKNDGAESGFERVTKLLYKLPKLINSNINLTIPPNK
jgi:hypothetical protein